MAYEIHPYDKLTMRDLKEQTNIKIKKERDVYVASIGDSHCQLNLNDYRVQIEEDDRSISSIIFRKHYSGGIVSEIREKIGTRFLDDDFMDSLMHVQVQFKKYIEKTCEAYLLEDKKFSDSAMADLINTYEFLRYKNDGPREINKVKVDTSDDDDSLPF